jgi:hypothetical protein
MENGDASAETPRKDSEPNMTTDISKLGFSIRIGFVSRGAHQNVTNFGITVDISSELPPLPPLTTFVP